MVHLHLGHTPNISASDPDVQDTLTWSASIAPLHGTATVSGTGSTPSQLVYEPDSNYYGSDSFTISVSDGNVTDEVAVNVKIIAVNDDPVIIQGDSLSVILSEDSFPIPWVEPTLTVGDFDLEDFLTWSVVDSSGERSCISCGNWCEPHDVYLFPKCKLVG